jgi:hypothetical protein
LIQLQWKQDSLYDFARGKCYCPGYRRSMIRYFRIYLLMISSYQEGKTNQDQRNFTIKNTSICLWISTQNRKIFERTFSGWIHGTNFYRERTQ